MKPKLPNLPPDARTVLPGREVTYHEVPTKTAAKRALGHPRLVSGQHPDIYVVGRCCDNAAGEVLAAFMSLGDAQVFSNQAVVTCRGPHEIEITRCDPTARESWRRFADDRRWSTDRWEHRAPETSAEETR